jgi:dTDP-4-dehydrorhamnose reductase
MEFSKKILLTGATGLLGSKLYPFLKQQGFNVVGQGHNTKADVNFDLRNQAATEDILNSVEPQLIINLAALADVDKCEQHIHDAYLLNVKTAENIVGWVKKHPKVEVIHISTDQIYDGSGPHREEDAMPINVYGLSKYCAEKVFGQVKSTILRTNFFGNGNMAQRGSFSDWLLECFRKQTPIKLFTDVYFSPLSFDTLMMLMLKMIEIPIPGVFNLGSRDGMSKRDFAIELAKVFSLSSDCAQDALVSQLNLKARRPGDMRMDCSLFEKKFNITLPLLKDEIRSLKVKS